MAYREIVYILAVFVHFAHPHCYICQKDCNHLPAALDGSDKLFISCNDVNLTILSQFIESNKFSNVRSLTIKTPFINLLKLEKFYNVSVLDLSGNNISTPVIKQTFNALNVNTSYTLPRSLNGTFPELLKLDISSNLLNNISLNGFQLNKLITLILKNNSIETLSDFQSTSLKFLDVKNNNLTILKLGSCPSIREIDASNNFIKEIYGNLSLKIPNIEVLNLSSNIIEELKDYNFNLTNLLKLDLKNNKISVISQKCFYGLNKLQFLDISVNKLKTISPSTFQYLNGLSQLLVSENNYLNSQDFGLLLATRRLKSVNASKTNQNKIPSSLTRSVRYLILSFNNISQIQCGDLDSYPLLNSLDLTKNNISYIEDDALGRLDFLITLNLDDNLLSVVPHTLPNNLKKLFLKNNRIKYITNTDFMELQKMNHLDLSFNKISEIKDESFSQLFSLEKLNLSGNPITNLSIGALTGPRKLKMLDLSYLFNLTKCEQTLCFPVPEYNNIQELHMENSPGLVSRFMKDVAALKTFKQLTTLNVANSNVTSIRKDLPTYLPRLNGLNVQGNKVNCSDVRNIFSWFTVTESKKCLFTIVENHSQDKSAKEESTTSVHIQKTTSSMDTINVTPTTYIISQTGSTPTIKETASQENITEGDTFDADADFLTNDLWYKSEDAVGIVEAYSSETPTSHPGLFIMLVLPLALVLTCLFINYSRIKKQRHNNPIRNEMDIEIPNISSELW